MNNIKKKIIFVTSFNQEIYNISGKNLLDSFIKNMKNNILCVCHENVIFESWHYNISNLVMFNLSKYNYLINWLKENKDIIPIELGGDNKSIMNYWNYRSSLWFRKIASLKYAFSKYRNNSRYIVWLDSDVTVKKNIPESLISKIICEYDVSYVYGKKREQCPKFSVETGFLIFSNKNDFKALRLWFREFKNKKYRKYKRFDDGYVFEMMIKNKKNEIKSKDLVEYKRFSFLNNRSKINKPLKHTEFHKYLKHKKGVNKKLLNI